MYRKLFFVSVRIRIFAAKNLNYHTMIITSIAFAALFLILAIVFIMGKGDMLIAGYNTADAEDKKKYDIKRLRIVMAVISVITAGFIAILPVFGDNKDAQLGSGAVFILIVIVFAILANTWAKNR